MRSNNSRKTGLPPGALVHIGEKTHEPVTIELFSYNHESLKEESYKNIQECLTSLERAKINWINIDGIHKVENVEAVGKMFDIHPLLLEDVLNTNQRPKVEMYEKHVFITLKMLSYDEGEKNIVYEHVSFILGDGYVISFQERPEDLFDPIRERLRFSKGVVRSKNADYLFYLLIDVIVDYYYNILEEIDVKIDHLENEVFTDADEETLYGIQSLKKELLFLVRTIFAIREAVGRIDRIEHKLIRKGTIRYIQDLYDHTVHIVETLEIYRDRNSSLMDVYFTAQSTKMNAVMKVLTVISTIFIPLTFIVGIYGMNLKMPETSSPYTYPILWGVMISIVIGMIIFFKRKKWL